MIFSENLTTKLQAAISAALKTADQDSDIATLLKGADSALTEYGSTLEALRLLSGQSAGTIAIAAARDRVIDSHKTILGMQGNELLRRIQDISHMDQAFLPLADEVAVEARGRTALAI